MFWKDIKKKISTEIDGKDENESDSNLDCLQALDATDKVCSSGSKLRTIYIERDHVKGLIARGSLDQAMGPLMRVPMKAHVDFKKYKCRLCRISGYVSHQRAYTYGITSLVACRI